MVSTRKISSIVIDIESQPGAIGQSPTGMRLASEPCGRVLFGILLNQDIRFQQLKLGT